VASQDACQFGTLVHFAADAAPGYPIFASNLLIFANIFLVLDEALGHEPNSPAKSDLIKNYAAIRY
jgi:hypothetical protein